jgi:hypothetical protein
MFSTDGIITIIFFVKTYYGLVYVKDLIWTPKVKSSSKKLNPLFPREKVVIVKK